MSRQQPAVIKAWNSQYKKSLMTLFVLLALYDGPKDATVIRWHTQEVSNFKLDYNLVSIYRTLRRLHNAGLVDVTLLPVPDQPPGKGYSLTDAGQDCLRKLMAENRDIFAVLATAPVVA